jgi:putative NADPH-quinone reductase
MGAVVLAISGSLRQRSFTEKMLDLCLEGMGAEIELHKFYPHRMNIGPCNSCWSCWGRKTPGQCVQQDDFQKILAVYQQADFFLLAAPLYVFDFPATVKNMLDRFFVVLEPAQLESAGGQTKHPTRFGRHPKTVLISSCGFPELDNFDLLRRHFRLICEHMALAWAGEILIPASGIARAPKLFDGKYDLIRTAGEELMRGSISPETTAAIAAPVMAAEDYRRMATLSFEGTMTAKAKMALIAVKAMAYRK